LTKLSFPVKNALDDISCPVCFLNVYAFEIKTVEESESNKIFW